jgi:AraC-like DNA-binding protein
VKLGKVELKGTISEEKLQLVDTALRNAGLEIINDNKNLLVEKVKSIIHQLVYLSDNLSKQNFSDYISEKVNRNYTHISSLFKSSQGVTIEKYIIGVKIERVKELLVYDQLSLNEISFKLKYSSVAHLSNQFKKMTGLTPSFYKQLRNTNGNKKKYA